MAVDALDAHLGVENTYGYFFTTFGRNSYDGLGPLLRSYVHYSLPIMQVGLALK